MKHNLPPTESDQLLLSELDLKRLGNYKDYIDELIEGLATGTEEYRKLYLINELRFLLKSLVVYLYLNKDNSSPYKEYTYEQLEEFRVEIEIFLYAFVDENKIRSGLVESTSDIGTFKP